MDEIDADADQRSADDRRVELLGFTRRAAEAGLPSHRLGERIGRGAGEHRHCQEPGPQNAQREDDEGELAGDGRNASAACSEVWTSVTPLACSVAAVVTM